MPCPASKSSTANGTTMQLPEASMPAHLTWYTQQTHRGHAVNNIASSDQHPANHPQARFWKLRQSELEGYNLQYSPLKPRQGDLTGETHQTTPNLTQSDEHSTAWRSTAATQRLQLGCC
jgi:hypothetical protein